VRTSRIYQGWKRVAITLEIMGHLRVESSGNYRERGVVDHEGNLLNDCLMKAGEVVNSGRNAHNYSPWVLLYDGVLRNSPTSKVVSNVYEYRKRAGSESL